MRNVRRVVLMMLTMVLLSSAAFAQSQATTGVIEGTVSDSSGAVLPGATVTVRNDRPLEFRFNEASADVLGLEAEWRPSTQLRLAIGAARYWESRDRPDAAAFDWNQTRLHARVTLLLRSETDGFRLPPALRTRPRAGNRSACRPAN